MWVNSQKIYDYSSDPHGKKLVWTVQNILKFCTLIQSENTGGSWKQKNH